MPFAWLKGVKGNEFLIFVFRKYLCFCLGLGTGAIFEKSWQQLLDDARHFLIVINPHTFIWSLLPKGYNRYFVEKKGFSVNEYARHPGCTHEERVRIKGLFIELINTRKFWKNKNKNCKEVIIAHQKKRTTEIAVWVPPPLLA